MRKRLAAEELCSRQVYVQGLLPIRPPDPRVVDEDVEAAETLDGGPDRFFDVSLVRDVSGNGDRPGLFGQCSKGLRTAPGCDHRRTFDNETPDDRGTDPGTTARHESDLAGQAHSVYCIQVLGR